MTYGCFHTTGSYSTWLYKALNKTLGNPCIPQISYTTHDCICCSPKTPRSPTTVDCCWCCCSLVNGAQQCCAAQHPLGAAVLTAQRECGDEVEALAGLDTVAGCLVHAAALLVLSLDTRHVQHRQGVEQLLGLAVHQLVLAPTPRAAIQVQAVDEDTLCRRLLERLKVLGRVRHLTGHHHVIQRPLVAGVLAVHLLLHGSQEALGVEEASHPVGLGAAQVEPLVELVKALQQASEPVTQRVGLPALLHPRIRDTRHVERIQCVNQTTTQCDSAGNSQT
mmetsp:Transcript_6834/g.15120  ORF Transcript_6834/g.15120 Transcript_6834/m.15120 type:complete len:278 (+) Transcript_6834:350-1183(+)